VPRPAEKEVYAVVAVIVILALAYLAYRHFSSGGGRTVTITVCNAGSLTIPLERVAQSFEKQYGVKVLFESSGSVEAVRKVTDFGKNCDVVAVADYRLIPMLMVPRYAKWYVAFATNSMVIVYSQHSKHAPEASKLTSALDVFKLFSRSDIRYGFSDPNRDPCGYRAVGVIGLAALATGNMSLLESLVIDKIPGSKYEIVNGTLHIYIPASVEARGNLVVRPKSVDLISMLESGAIDYAFEYRSVAVQHNLSYILLPPEVNLADPSKAEWYSKVVVHILTGTSKEKAIPMAPIVYGVTVPVNAEHPREALLFVKYLLENGRSVFESLGQPFLPKPLGYGEIPEELGNLVAHVEG
jgi:molybdate/tungstate transport system substrate-binding protein